MGEWRGDMVYVNRDPEKAAQEGKQREKESGLQGDKGDGGGKSDYWGSPSLKEGNYTLACKNTQQGKTLVADDRGNPPVTISSLSLFFSFLFFSFLFFSFLFFSFLFFSFLFFSFLFFSFLFFSFLFFLFFLFCSLLF